MLNYQLEIYPEDCALHHEGDSNLERTWLGKLMNEELSPLFASSFEGVPPAYVVTMGHDCLRDDGLLYVKRLRDSGQVPLVEHKHYPTKYHAWFNFNPRPIVDDLHAFLEAHPSIL